MIGDEDMEKSTTSAERAGRQRLESADARVTSAHHMESNAKWIEGVDSAITAGWDAELRESCVG